jgi:hypothetical protein
VSIACVQDLDRVGISTSRQSPDLVLPGACNATARHSRPRWTATFNFRVPPSMAGMVGVWVGAAWGPLRTCSEVRAHIATGTLGTATPTAFHPRHSVKSARIRLVVSLAPPAAQFLRPRRTAARGLQAPPSAVRMVGGCRPVRAYGEVRAHTAPSELGAATPTAMRPSWAPDEKQRSGKAV